MSRSAEELHRAAVDLLNQGRVGEAERALSGAERALGPAERGGDDASLRARIAGTRAYAMARRGDLAGAERVCAAALDLPGVDDHSLAVLAGQMGALAEQSGRLADAESWLTRGIEGLTGDAVAWANLLVNRSLVHMQRGDLDAARADTRAACETFAGLGMVTDEAQARHNEGYIALLAGDVIAALRAMTRARRTIEAMSTVAAAISDIDRAEVLRDAGLTREAEELLAKAAEQLGASRMPRVRAEAEFNLARSLLSHDPLRARRVAGVAARRFERLGVPTWAARARALRMRAELAGGIVLRSGASAPWPKRIPGPGDVHRAAVELDELGFRNEASALRASAELAQLRRGAPALSTTVRVPSRASLEVRLLAHEVRAARAAARGRDAETRRHAGRGLDELASWQREFGSLDLQTSASMHASGLVLAGIDASVRSGRPDAVFAWSERARHVSQQVVPLRPPPDPALAEDLSDLRMMRADDPAWLDSRRASELRDRVRERQWSATGSASVERRIELDELRGVLDGRTAVLSYVFSGNGLAAVVATAAGARVVELDDWPTIRGALPGLRADLDMSASIRAGALGDVVRRSLGDRLDALSRALLEAPLRATGDLPRIVIATPGVLAGIPWGMLSAMRGRSFTLATSATRWAALHARPATPPTSVGFVAGPRVARGEEEVDDASGAWSSPVVLRGEAASVSAVTTLAHGVDVLHVAAHGRHSVDNPLFSGIELSDGTLFGYDIDLIPEVPDTVVLSACEVGRSSVRWGEEAIGMTRIWLHAGTRCVIASPVVVADDDACVLLAAVHAGLARGAAPADALAEAAAETGILAPFQAHGAGF